MTFRSLLALLALTAAVTAAQPAHAFSYVTPTDDALLSQADGVVVATVQAPLRASGDRLDDGGYIVEIERAVSGFNLQGTQRLALPPMPVNGVDHMTWGVPVLEPGERVLVFYQRDAVGTLRPLHLALGVFMAARADDGSDAWLRSLDGGENLSKAHNAKFHDARHAQRFEHYLTARAAGMAPPPDYLLSVQATRSTSNTKHRLMPTPWRWFTFDSGGGLPWKSTADGAAGVSFDEATAIQQATAAWSNDAGSRINTSYAGTVASDPGNNSRNGVHAIIWNDPDNDIAGSFSCSSGGTLAIGGAWFTGSSTSYNGRSYRDGIEGYVIVQDGAGCYFAAHSGRNGAEVLAHEIGHTLGFGHACGDSPTCANPAENQAIMRARAHGDGRGANLGSDDRAVANLVYPAPSGGGATPLFKSGFE